MKTSDLKGCYGKFSSKSAFREKPKKTLSAIFSENISAMHERTVLQAQFALIIFALLLIIMLCIKFHGIKFLALGQVQKSFETPRYG